jgi:hypothetical protein
LRNEFEKYTCGGCTYWPGNDDSINTEIIITSRYEPNITLVILGVIIVLLVFILYLYVFHYRNWTKKPVHKYEKTSLVSDESIY